MAVGLPPVKKITIEMSDGRLFTVGPSEIYNTELQIEGYLDVFGKYKPKVWITLLLVSDELELSKYYDEAGPQTPRLGGNDDRHRRYLEKGR